MVPLLSILSECAATLWLLLVMQANWSRTAPHLLRVPRWLYCMNANADAFLQSITRANCPKCTSMHGASDICDWPAPVRAGRPQSDVSASPCQRRAAAVCSPFFLRGQWHTDTQTPLSLRCTSGFVCLCCRFVRHQRRLGHIRGPLQVAHFR